MAMNTTRDDGSQSMWVATADLPQSAAHPFSPHLNHILSAAGFDAFVEGLLHAVLRDDGAADSLSLRPYLHLAPPPDHSMISRTRPMFPVETHQPVSTSTQ